MLGPARALSQRARSWIRARFTVDTRALAAVRILLGLVLIADLIHRAPAIGRYYTDAGVLPTAAYHTMSASGLSLHALSGAAGFQWLLFVLTGLLAAAFTLGYRTLPTGIAAWILLYSLHARNPFVLNGGDLLLRVLFLIALTTPLGERWSLDARRRVREPRNAVATYGTAALLIQPLAVFTSNALIKHGGSTWFAGDGLSVAMRNQPLTTPVGHALTGAPSLLTVLTYAWVVLLSASILLLWLPTGRWRAVSALAYIGAFAGMALTMAVGWFPLVLTAAVIPYLTPSFWDAVEDRWPARWRLPIPQAATSTPITRRLAARLRERGHGVLVSVSAAASRGAGTVFGVALLVWIVLFSAVTVTGADPPEPLDSPYLDQQRWGLFAPNPAARFGWYVAEAQTTGPDGTDTVTGGPFDLDRTPTATDPFDSFRDRKFMEAVWSSSRGEDGIVATHYAAWTCRNAQAHLDRPVQEVTVHRVNHVIDLDGTAPEPGRFPTTQATCTTP